jgi:hypothetical protein
MEASLTMSRSLGVVHPMPLTTKSTVLAKQLFVHIHDSWYTNVCVK